MPRSPLDFRKNLKLFLWFRRFFKNLRQPAGRNTASIVFEKWPRRVYAIGDIHGCYDLLRAIENAIIADAGTSANDAYIVTLGDMIDRGPASREVLEHLMEPLPGFTRIALMGNHEAMLLDFLLDPSPASAWLRSGGLETLRSFDLDPFQLMAVPYVERRRLLRNQFGESMLEFLQSLPAYVELPGAVLVHAGIRPAVPMHRQTSDDLFWIREPFLSADRNDELLVVHGHTPSDRPQVKYGRIGIDTGAYKTGVLSAVCLEPDRKPRLRSVNSVEL